MPDTDPQIYREALRWMVRRHSGDWHADDEVRLVAWLDAHPDHGAAWQRAQREWIQWGELRTVAAREVADTLQQRPARGWKIAGLVAAFAFISAAFALHRLPGALSRESLYETQIGGHHTVNLPDGSTVELNTSSQLSVEFGFTCRCLRLLSGEAVFRAEHGDPRPFRVLSGSTTTRDIGTEFWIRERPEGTAIAVLEGVVEISSKALTGPRQLRARDRIWLGADGTELPAGDVPLQDLTAWRRGEIVFRDAALADVLAEFARYHDLQFQLDARLSIYHLSGRFASTDLEGLLHLIESAYPVQVQRDLGSRRLTLRAR